MAADIATGRARFALAAVVLAALYLAAPAAAADYRQIVLDGHTLKWGAPVTGSGAVVTYAEVAGPQSFPGARNCPVVAPLGRLLASNRIDRATFARERDAAFAAWSAVADIRFRQVDAADADILIGAEATPSGRAFTNVEYADLGGTEPASLTRSVICLSPAEPWKIGFDGDLAVYDIRYTLMHEIGHAIGLDHPGRPGELMDFRYRETFRLPQLGDTAGAAFLYGPNPVEIASRPGLVRKVNAAAQR